MADLMDDIMGRLTHLAHKDASYREGKAAGIAEERARSRFLAFDIGCIECGEPSDVIGLYETLEDAQQACATAEAKQRADWRGQHRMEVFVLRADAVSSGSDETPHE